MFLPIRLILAVVADFPTETLAALLGVTAGYVLSLGTHPSGRFRQSWKRPEPEQR